MILNWDRLLEAMERVTGQDRDISVLWLPDDRGANGQGTQREFLEKVRAEYEALVMSE